MACPTEYQVISSNFIQVTSSRMEFSWPFSSQIFIEVNHEQSNYHQVPLKAVTKDPHSSKCYKRFKYIKEGSKAVN